MLDQLFRVKISNVDKTERVSTCTVTETIRVYQVATFQIDESPATETDVVIDHGEKTFVGFVYKVEKTSKGLFTVECRSYSAKLTEPYHSNGDYRLEDSSTSHDLCAEYSARYGIAINITAINVDFGGNFERRGTPLAALTSIASTTGAEIWWDGTTLQIQPNKPITEDGTIIRDYDVFDFMPMQNPIYQRGIKFVEVNGNTSQSTSSVSCNVEVDKCNGFVTANIVPHDSYDNAEGIELDPVRKRMNHNSSMDPSVTLQLEAHIVSIDQITINKGIVTDYTIEYDTIVFSSEKRGLVVVDYIGYAYEGYANIVNINGTRYSEFDIFYNGCDRYSFQDEMLCNDSSGYDECLGTIIMTPKVMNYGVGFNIQTVGSDPMFSFFSDTSIIPVSPVKTTDIRDWVERGSLSIENDGTVRHALRFTPYSLTEVRSGGTDITANCSLDGNYVVFDKEYRNVAISYSIVITNYYIRFDAHPDSNVTMVVNECEYSLEGINTDSTTSTECILGVTVPINMIEELGVKPFNAIGKEVTVRYPDDTVITLYVNSFGILYVPDIQRGDHKIDVTNISKTARMVLVSAAQ